MVVELCEVAVEFEGLLRFILRVVNHKRNIDNLDIKRKWMNQLQKRSLSLRQRIEVVSQCHQLRVISLFDYPAILKYHYSVTILHSAQSVCDRN